MNTKRIEIDGNKFSNLNEYYSEIENKLTQNQDWKKGWNLDALNDILGGGFGVFEYGESVSISWKNSQKSKTDLESNSSSFCIFWQNIKSKASENFYV